MSWIRTNWSVITGITLALLFLAQLIFGFASDASQIDQNTRDIGSIQDDVESHVEKDSHEGSARTLVRIETQQKSIKQDVDRIQNKIDVLNDKLDTIIRGR